MSKQNTGRKFFATAATAALVASAIVPVASAAKFTDADKIASWAKEAVEALSAKEVITGNPDGSFNPTGDVTRAQAAKMFTVALDLDTEGTENFTDVKDGQWFQEYVVAVANAGIVNGMTTTEFAPNGKLTRAQAAKMIVEAYGFEGEADLSKFADAKTVAGKWSEAYLSTAVANGIINGKGDKLAANDSISRQEFAVMLTRAIDAATDNSAELLAAVEEATKALDTAVKALNTEVKVEEIEAAKAEVTSAETAIVALETALEAAKEVVTEEQAAKANEAIAAAKKAIETTKAAIAKAEEAAKVLAVESVTAENATKLVVKFTKAVDKNTISVADFKIGKLDGQTLTTPDLVGVLSEDGKTFTIETTKGEFFTKRYDVEVAADSIKSKDGSSIVAYETTITVEDKTAPAITTTEVVQATSDTVDVTVNFTEQLSSVGTVSVDGVVVTPEFTANGKKLVIKGLKAGQTYKIDIVGAKDVAGNLANPLSTSVVTTEDTVAPTVALSVKESTITLDFSEEVANTFVVTVNGTTITASKNQDAKDKTVYTVDASQVLSGSITFLNNAEVKVSSIVDLAGNAGKVATLTTNLVKDTTAPKFVSSFIEDDTLVLKYDEAIKASTASAITNAGLTIKYADKDGVQHSLATTDFTASSVHGYDLNGNGTIDANTDEEKFVSVTLAEASAKDFIDAGKLVTGKYTVTVAKDLLTDAVGNKVAASTFTVETSATAATKSVLFSVNTTGVETNQFVVVYNELMGASALEAANYTLGGAKLPEGTKLAFVNDKKNVLVTLPEGYVTVTGPRSVEVANVVAVSGNTQDVKNQTNQTVTLNENVAPTAKTVTIQNDETVTVDFNENLANLASVTGVTVKVNGAKVTPASVVVSNGDLVIKLAASSLKATDKVTVEFESANIADASGNKVKDGSINN